VIELCQRAKSSLPISMLQHICLYDICFVCFNSALTLNLPTTTIVAQPFNFIKWQLKFNPVA